MTISINVPVGATSALQQFLRDRPDPVPDDVRAKLWEIIDPALMVSPVEACHQLVELIYARRDELTGVPALLEIAAQTATMMATHRLFGMQVDDRGYAITAELRRMPAVESEAPAPETLPAPEPDEKFLPEQEPPEPATGNDPVADAVSK